MALLGMEVVEDSLCIAIEYFQTTLSDVILKRLRENAKSILQLLNILVARKKN